MLWPEGEAQLLPRPSLLPAAAGKLLCMLWARSAAAPLLAQQLPGRWRHEHTLSASAVGGRPVSTFCLAAATSDRSASLSAPYLSASACSTRSGRVATRAAQLAIQRSPRNEGMRCTIVIIAMHNICKLGTATAT